MSQARYSPIALPGFAHLIPPAKSLYFHVINGNATTAAISFPGPGRKGSATVLHCGLWMPSCGPSRFRVKSIPRILLLKSSRRVGTTYVKHAKGITHISIMRRLWNCTPTGWALPIFTSSPCIGHWVGLKTWRLIAALETKPTKQP